MVEPRALRDPNPALLIIPPFDGFSEKNVQCLTIKGIRSAILLIVVEMLKALIKSIGLTEASIFIFTGASLSLYFPSESWPQYSKAGHSEKTSDRASKGAKRTHPSGAIESEKDKGLAAFPAVARDAAKQGTVQPTHPAWNVSNAETEKPWAVATQSGLTHLLHQPLDVWRGQHHHVCSLHLIYAPILTTLTLQSSVTYLF